MEKDISKWKKEQVKYEESVTNGYCVEECKSNNL